MAGQEQQQQRGSRRGEARGGESVKFDNGNFGVLGQPAALRRHLMRPQDEKADTSCKVISHCASEMEQHEAAHMHFKGSSRKRKSSSRKSSSRRGSRRSRSRSRPLALPASLRCLPANPKQLRLELLRCVCLCQSSSSLLPPTTRVYNKCGNCFLFAILIRMGPGGGQKQRVPLP